MQPSHDAPFNVGPSTISSLELYNIDHHHRDPDVSGLDTETAHGWLLDRGWAKAKRVLLIRDEDELVPAVPPDKNMPFKKAVDVGCK
jgi:hypothetical protein